MIGKLKSVVAILILGFLVAEVSHAANLSFNECAQPNASRGRLDNFCPRLEGSYLDLCCPTVFKQNPISCYYYTDATKPHYSLTSKGSCKAGVASTVTCCVNQPEPCAQNIVELPFIQRLIKREAACCFEDCPPADYWRSQPRPDGRVTPNHELAGRSRPANDCNGQVVDECGGAISCDAVEDDNSCTPTTTNPPITSPTGTNPPITNPPITSPPTTGPPVTLPPIEAPI